MKKTCKFNKLLTSILVLVIVMLCVLSGCTDSSKDKFTIYFDEVFSVTPYITIETSNTFYLKHKNEIEARIGDMLVALDEKFDTDDENSMIYKVNQEAGQKKVEVDSEFAYIVSKAKLVSSQVTDKYDVTVYGLSKLWKFKENYFKGTNFASIPSSSDIYDELEYVGYNNINIAEASINGNVKYYINFTKIGTKIDLGSIVKGYATDKTAEILKEIGVNNFIINIGGNVYTSGDITYNVGITTPYYEDYDQDANIVGYVKTDKNIEYTFVTSGIYERYIKTNDGSTYHHILDPKTGYPIDSDLLGVTIIKTSTNEIDEQKNQLSCDADALSTAVFTMGLTSGLTYVNNNPKIEAVFITKDKKIYLSDGIKDAFVYNEKLNKYSYALGE